MVTYWTHKMPLKINMGNVSYSKYSLIHIKQLYSMNEWSDSLNVLLGKNYNVDKLMRESLISCM